MCRRGQTQRLAPQRQRPAAQVRSTVCVPQHSRLQARVLTTTLLAHWLGPPHLTAVASSISSSSQLLKTLNNSRCCCGSSSCRWQRSRFQPLTNPVHRLMRPRGSSSSSSRRQLLLMHMFTSWSLFSLSQGVLQQKSACHHSRERLPPLRPLRHPMVVATAAAVHSQQLRTQSLQQQPDQQVMRLRPATAAVSTEGALTAAAAAVVLQRTTPCGATITTSTSTRATHSFSRHMMC